MKTILIFGGSGFIGRHLVEELMQDYKLIILSRSEPKRSIQENVSFEKYSTQNPKQLLPLFNQADGVINLAGQNIGEKQWSNAFRDQILQSRIEMGNLIKDTFLICENKPRFFIQGSASGYYGINPSSVEITENRPSTRDSFLTNVAFQSEENVLELAKLTRLIFIRTGIVLDAKQGALPQMALPFKLFAGGPMGSGKQWIPWIHIEDEVKAIRFVIEHKKLSGPVNLTAPHPVPQKEFARALGKALKRPSLLPAPAFALKLILGKDRANDLLLSGLKVIPDKLIKEGFKFRFNTINEALNAIYLNS